MTFFFYIENFLSKNYKLLSIFVYVLALITTAHFYKTEIVIAQKTYHASDILWAFLMYTVMNLTSAVFNPLTWVAFFFSMKLKEKTWAIIIFSSTVGAGAVYLILFTVINIFSAY